MKYAQKPYHFGIHLGVGLSDFKIKQNALFAQSDSILGITSKYGAGFEIGALISYHINRFVEVRTVPSFMFADKNLHYSFGNGTIVDKTISQVYFDLPVEMKFKSEPLKDVKFYLVAGLKYGYDIGGNFKVRKQADMPRQSAHDFGVNYGVGLEIHFPQFIFAPEFKVFNSVLSIHKEDNALPYSKYIKGLYNRTFTFSINFEG